MPSSRALSGASQLRRAGPIADDQLALLRHQQAGERVEQFALTVARHARDADDFAGAQPQRHIGEARHVEGVAPMQMPCFEQRGARRDATRIRAAPGLHTPSDHRLRQCIDTGIGDRAVEHHCAAAHHGDRVAQRHDLLELVRDQQHRGAAFAQAPQCREELFRFLRREHGGGLIQDQDPRTTHECLEDLQALPFAHRQVFDGPVQPHVQAGVVHQRVEPGAQLVPRIVQPPMTLCAEQDVVERAEGLDEHEVLMHHADAQRNRVFRVVDAHGQAIDPDAAAVGAVKTIQHRHQRALAGAVLADDAVHRAGVDRQIDITIRLHRTEALVDAVHRHGRRGVA
jgi:hypothetical protein